MKRDVSFLATFYNKERFIPLVLASLFDQQGLDDVEYIFVDDGSTDDTLALLKKLSKGRKNVKIISQRNQGPAIATNVGFALCSKTFTKFVDGDDLLHPQLTRTLIDEMVKYKAKSAYAWDPQVNWYNGEVKNSWAKRKRAFHPIPKKIKTTTVDLRQFLKGHVCNPSMFLAYTSTVKRAEATDPKVFIQDYSLSLRVRAQGPCVWVHINAVQFPAVTPDRLSQNSLQTTYDMNKALENFTRDYWNTLSYADRRYAVRHGCLRASKFLRKNKVWHKGLFAWILSLVSLIPGCTHPILLNIANSPIARCGNIRSPN